MHRFISGKLTVTCLAKKFPTLHKSILSGNRIIRILIRKQGVKVWSE